MSSRPRLGDADQLDLSLELRDQVRFLVRAHDLTEVDRLNRLVSDRRSESSAEHSWHLALTAMVLHQFAPVGVALDRVLRMLIIHDLVEVVTGDTVIYDEQARVAAEDLERVAARDLFGSLPAPTGEEFASLWAEFEDAETSDARFARSIDRLQPILLHWAGAGQAWASRGVTEQQERDVAAKVSAFEPALAGLATALVDDAARRGMLADPARPAQPSAE